MTDSGQVNAVRSQPGSDARRRIDERLLGDSTTLRFALLIVLFVAEATAVAMAGTARLFGEGWNARIMGVVVVLGLLGVAAAVYRLVPAWRFRQGQSVYVPVVPGTGEDSDQTLQHLVEVAKTEQRAQFVIDTRSSGSGRSYGTRRNATVVIGSRLWDGRRADPAALAIVVLHELAHVRNRDVGITRMTVTLWHVIIGVIVPLQALLIWDGLVQSDVLPGAAPLARLAIDVGLAFVASRSILRTREYYADLTAFRLAPAPLRTEFLAKFSDLADREQARARGRAEVAPRAWGRLREAWRSFAGESAPLANHPSWASRRQALDHPDELFRIRWVSVFYAGVAASVAGSQFISGLALESGASNQPWAATGLQVAIATVAMGIAGIATWRAVAYSEIAPLRIAPNGWAAGAWLGAGLGFGDLLQIAGEGRVPSTADWLRTALIVCGCSLLLAFVVEHSRFRVQTYRGPSLDAAAWQSLVPAGLALAFLLRWWNDDVWHLDIQSEAERGLLAAELPSGDGQPFLAAAAMLAHLPGSDLSLTGLWWAPAMLWIVALGHLTGLHAAPVAPRAARAFFLVGIFRPVLSLIAAFGCVFLASRGLGGVFLVSLAAVLGIRAMQRVALRVRLEDAGDRADWRTTFGVELPARVDGTKPGRMLVIACIGGLGAVLAVAVMPSSGSLGDPPAERVAAVAYTVFVLAAAVLATGAVVGALGRSRLPLLAGLAGGGVCATIGLVGLLVIQAVAGCLSPVSALASVCSGDPLHDGARVLYVAGFALGPAVLVAGALSAAAARVAPRPRVDEPLSERPGRAVAGWHARGIRSVVVVAAAIVLTATGFQTVVWGGAFPPTGLLRAYQLPAEGSAPFSLAPEAEWMRHVGGIFLNTADVFDTLAPEVGAVEQGASPVGRQERIDSACEELRDIYSDAESRAWHIHPNVSPAADAALSAYVTQMQEAVGLCKQMAAASTRAEFLSATQDFLRSDEGAGPAAESLGAILASGGSQGPDLGRVVVDGRVPLAILALATSAAVWTLIMRRAGRGGATPWAIERLGRHSAVLWGINGALGSTVILPAHPLATQAALVAGPVVGAIVVGSQPPTSAPAYRSAFGTGLRSLVVALLVVWVTRPVLGAATGASGDIGADLAVTLMCLAVWLLPAALLVYVVLRAGIVAHLLGDMVEPDRGNAAITVNGVRHTAKWSARRLRDEVQRNQALLEPDESFRWIGDGFLMKGRFTPASSVLAVTDRRILGILSGFRIAFERPLADILDLTVDDAKRSLTLVDTAGAMTVFDMIAVPDLKAIVEVVQREHASVTESRSGLSVAPGDE